jgi:feruloyl esterase
MMHATADAGTPSMEGAIVRILCGVFRAAVMAVLLLQSSRMTAAAPCERLTSLSFPDATITRAETVAAGRFVNPGGTPSPAFATLPAFCRVTAVLKPSSDSHIEMELWLPVDNWNGKFQAVGNGGWAGLISYGVPPGASLADGLKRGYATASTDTGHKGANAFFAIGHPEKLIDFGYRAVHEMTVKSKTIVAEFYGRPARLSYWNGCSTGGRQGLMAAQKYPADFDGIVAGAPANYHTHLHAWDLSVSVPVLLNPASAVPPAKLEMLNRAVIQACDAGDGVEDGLLNDPRSCTFDPATLLCRGSDTDQCLTPPQLESVRKMYAPAKTRRGAVIFPGKPPGSESRWMAIAGGAQPASVALGTFQAAYNDANWDWKTFDIDRDLKIVDDRVGRVINAVNPDLSAFKSRGGKLLLYHGWNDPGIPAGNTINYYNSVLAKMGRKQDEWMRLFLAPGMQHCFGGPGPNQADYLGALERWRESGAAPDQIVASHATNNVVDMTRPLCPYPQLATYRGTGSVNDAANFVCQLSPAARPPSRQDAPARKPGGGAR